jgi:hypothetical protein
VVHGCDVVTDDHAGNAPFDGRSVRELGCGIIDHCRTWGAVGRAEVMHAVPARSGGARPPANVILLSRHASRIDDYPAPTSQVIPNAIVLSCQAAREHESCRNSGNELKKLSSTND